MWYWVGIISGLLFLLNPMEQDWGSFQAYSVWTMWLQAGGHLLVVVVIVVF